MSLPLKLAQKFTARFDELLAEGERIRQNIKIIPGDYDPNYWQSGGRGHQRPDNYSWDGSAFMTWRTNVVSLLSQTIPSAHVHYKMIDEFAVLSSPHQTIKGALGILNGIKDDFQRGLLGDLGIQIEAELAADYMGQAEQLLNEGQTGKFDHVPAAVLAGAVLEKALRNLCVNHQPPVSVLKNNGDFKTLNPLIDDLKKAGAFNEAKAKQLRAWADIRNHAAHGEFDQFSRKDVEQMLPGIGTFLAEFLK